MSDGIYSALSGAIAQQRSLDVVANNVANANTTGFKADRVAFAQAVQGARRVRPNLPDPLRYVAVAEVRVDPSAGPLRRTGNPFDVALQGDGFFAVETAAGERYTRAGAFVTDGEGTIRTQDGHRVLGVPPSPTEPPVPIVVPPGTSEVQIASDGTVRADGEAVGRLRIVEVAPRALRKEGSTLFAAAGGRPREAESVSVVQGHLEMANVNAVAGLNELIMASRSFEAFQRVIHGFRQIDERTARELGDTR